MEYPCGKYDGIVRQLPNVSLARAGKKPVQASSLVCFLLSRYICSLDTCNACRVPFFAKRSETALISSKSRLVGLYRREIRLIECNVKYKKIYR